MLSRAPTRKAAVAYLAASGAVPISIVKSGAAPTFAFSTANKITGRTIAARWWTASPDAARIASAARQAAGTAADLAECKAVLARCATSAGATLTPEDVAIAGASAAITRLDAMVDTMRRNGTLAEFNARYKSGRAAAAVEGRGFMAYSVAMARLKRALIPMLQQGKPISEILVEVFR